MKKKFLLLSILCYILVIALVWNRDNNQFISESDTVILPSITLENKGDTIVSNYYDNGFDFDYNMLPILTLAEDEDQLIIQLSDDFRDEVQLGEDYTVSSQSLATTKRNTYSLTKNDEDIVTLPIRRRTNYSEEKGVYYLKNKKGTFVFKVELPVNQSTSSFN